MDSKFLTIALSPKSNLDTCHNVWCNSTHKFATDGHRMHLESLIIKLNDDEIALINNRMSSGKAIPCDITPITSTPTQFIGTINKADIPIYDLQLLANYAKKHKEQFVCTITFKADTLTLAYNYKHLTMQTWMPMSFTAKEPLLEIHINPIYLFDALSNMTKQTIHINLDTTKTTPMLKLNTENDDQIAYIMGMK